MLGIRYTTPKCDHHPRSGGPGTGDPQTNTSPAHKMGGRVMPAVSEAKLNANRANAQHSTGPKTLEGKLASSQNPSSHGAFCQNLESISQSLHIIRG